MIKLKSVAMMSLPLLFAVCALPVLAVEVTFTTTGEFCAGAGPCTTGSPSTTIGIFPEATYLVANPEFQSVPINTSNVPLINFDIGAFGSDPRTGTGSFTIHITETAPSAGSGVFNGALSGNFAVGSGTAEISFSQPSIVIGGVMYTLNTQTYIVPTNGASEYNNPVLVDVTAVTTPEPGFLAVTGLSFGCLMFAGYRRRRTG
jgi:hypothetical protein